MKLRFLLLIVTSALFVATSTYSQTVKSVMVDQNNVMVTPFGNGSATNPSFKIGSTNTGFYLSAGGLTATRNGNVAWSAGSNSISFSMPFAFGGTNASNNRAQSLTNLGATSVGFSLFTAVDAAAARSVLGVSTGGGGDSYWTLNPTYNSLTQSRKIIHSVAYDETLPENDNYVYHMRTLGTNEQANGLQITAPNSHASAGTLLSLNSRQPFSTNILNRLLVNTMGNVGINVTQPTEKLHVGGNVKITGNLLMDSPEAIKDRLLTTESMWGEQPNPNWGPRAYFGDTKSRSLEVFYHTGMRGRLTIGDLAWSNSQLNSTVPSTAANDFYAARFSSEKSDNARGVLINLTNTTSSNSHALHILSGPPAFTNINGTNVLTDSNSRFLVRADGRVGVGTTNLTSALTVKGAINVTDKTTTLINLLPALTGNAGRVLGVNSSANSVEWINQSSGGGGFTGNTITLSTNISGTTHSLILDFMGISAMGNGFGRDLDFFYGQMLGNWDMYGNIYFRSNVSFSLPSAVRSNLGFNSMLNNLWSATSQSNARDAVGLGATDSVTFSNVTVSSLATGTGATGGYVTRGSSGQLTVVTSSNSTGVPALYGHSGFGNATFNGGASAPTNTTTPHTWIAIESGGTSFRIPVYK